MVSQICRSEMAVEVVVGVPRSGKTFALSAARRAWTASGYVVVGAALAAEAAAQLQASSSITAGTLHSLLAGAESGREPLGPRTVVVVDEAGMVDTRRLARLMGLADWAGARVVLTGDDRQLPAVEAAGAYARAGRVHTSADSSLLVDQMIQRWWSARVAGEEAAIFLR